MSKNLKHIAFKDIDINNGFFDSLKEDYSEFEEWVTRKKDKYAYIQYSEDEQIEGFLYYKLEKNVVNDVVPIIKANIILKIGTFKINPHGTRLGERFIKKTLDYAIYENASLCYVTLFEKHVALLQLFKTYGFIEYGTKTSCNGTEIVLVKDLISITGDIYLDYPLINARGKQKYILSIYPKYHSIMFPDSILKTETVDILEDVTITNSINKIYVARMSDLNKLKYGDIMVIYRTAEENKSAEYSSVATSVCIVTEVKSQSEFNNFNEFYRYASEYSIFDRNDLNYWYKKGGCYTIRMTYNAALSKRLTRHKLIESIGIDREEYCGFLKLTDSQFEEILKEGGVNENLLIN
ncbi:MAG: N-acetyltransferase [Peptostreptococcaceae bacterium]|nr:N-acetyltransferase [Peptostreptococcaceae bacterium]